MPKPPPPTRVEMDDRDDKALVRACLRGDESAWEALILRYKRLVFSIPLQCGLSSAEADDVFQLVSVRLLENLGKIKKVESVASWISTTARRESWRLSRRASRETEWEADDDPRFEADALQRIESVEREHAVALALEKLDEPCRSLLYALYVEDPSPSYQEISKRFGRPVGAIGPTRARCLKKLKRIYTQAGGAVPEV